eukprot:gnl/TRDRNA2_/TRDRNA2_171808_c8_seq3.p1 gnl/TRDRNA2_/TRDRNA2_171808_c8~~gnl/TRDRNA2_/TRDRNA2_171808_c8_seq3.p1  ORF type:complete len:590 (-),score=85.04 gnl/TRDRNA2_/TRDRNA2_171808_c8_seq3:98-1867(-)
MLTPPSFDFGERDRTSAASIDDFCHWLSETLQTEHATIINRFQTQLNEHHHSVMAAVSSRLRCHKDATCTTVLVDSKSTPPLDPVDICLMEREPTAKAIPVAPRGRHVTLMQEKGGLASSKLQSSADTEPAGKKPQLSLKTTPTSTDVKESWLAGWVKSDQFESVSAMLIFACTMVMAVDIEYRGLKTGYELKIDHFSTPSDEVWPGMDRAVLVLDVVFNSLFLAELMLRSFVMRCDAIRNGWIWFDGFLVTSGWLDTCGLMNVGMDPMILRVVRLVRLLRLLKVVKSIKAFETLFLLIRSIQASLGALIWSFLLLVLVQVVMAILLSQLLTAFMENETKDLAVRQRVFMYFGTFTKSLVSMFEVTMGNWGPVTRLLYVDVSEWYGVVFVVFRCCLMFATLKVITAVFIAETVRAAASDDEVVGMKKQRQADAYVFRMRKIFSQLDTSGDGSLTRKEFEPLLNDERIQLVLHTLEIDTHDLDPLFEILDNGDGEIDIDEFLGGMSRMRGPAKSMDLLRVLSHVERLERKFVQFGSHFGIVTEPQINGSAKRTSIGDQRNQVPANTGCTSSRSSALNEEEEQKMMKGLGV